MPDELKLALALAIALAIGVALALLRERRRSRRAQESALRDPLTSLANRVAFDQRMAIEWERFRRHGRPFGVLMLDLDELKRVNDEHGHSAGDRVLQQAGASIGERVRRSDFPARFGGDEFCVISAETDEDGLRDFGESLRRSIEADGNPVSVGWALASPDDEGPVPLLDRADSAMYEDKRSRGEDYRGRSEPSVKVLRPAPPSTADLLAGHLRLLLEAQRKATVAAISAGSTIRPEGSIGISRSSTSSGMARHLLGRDHPRQHGVGGDPLCAFSAASVLTIPSSPAFDAE